jgi:hypothetical protein
MLSKKITKNIEQQNKRQKELLRKLSVDKQTLDKGIEIYEENLKEMEEALRNNVKYPSNRLMYETILVIDYKKEKLVWFLGLFMKYKLYRYRKKLDKPTKKLSKYNRKVLEEIIEEQKKTIANLKQLRSRME